MSDWRRRQLHSLCLVVGFLTVGAGLGVGVRAVGAGVAQTNTLVLALGAVTLGGTYLVGWHTFDRTFHEYFALGVALVAVTAGLLLASKDLPATMFQ